MDTTRRLLATYELEKGVAEFWHDVDTNWGHDVERFFTADALFVSGPRRYEGIDAIKGFYSWREGRGPRIAVHAVNNFRAHFPSETEAHCTWYMTIFAADGEPPLPSEPAARISLVTEHYRFDDGEARWRCFYRRFDLLFQGGNQLTEKKGGPSAGVK